MIPVICDRQVLRHSVYLLGERGEADGTNFSQCLTLNFPHGLPDRDSKRLEPPSPDNCE